MRGHERRPKGTDAASENFALPWPKEVEYNTPPSKWTLADMNHIARWIKRCGEITSVVYIQAAIVNEIANRMAARAEQPQAGKRLRPTTARETTDAPLATS